MLSPVTLLAAQEIKCDSEHESLESLTFSTAGKGFSRRPPVLADARRRHRRSALASMDPLSGAVAARSRSTCTGSIGTRMPW